MDTCDVSSFDWAYKDKETCLLIDKVVTVCQKEDNLLILVLVT